MKGDPIPIHRRDTPDENRGPVKWCDRCHRERVQVDWRRDEQICWFCESENEPPEAA